MGQLEQDQARYCELMKRLAEKNEEFRQDDKEFRIRLKWVEEGQRIRSLYSGSPKHTPSAMEKEATNKGCAAGIVAAAILIINIIIAVSTGYSWALFILSAIAVIVCIVIYNRQDKIGTVQEQLTKEAEKVVFEEEKGQALALNDEEFQRSLRRLDVEKELILKPLVDEMDAIVEKNIQGGSWAFFSIVRTKEYEDVFLSASSIDWHGQYRDKQATKEQKEALQEAGYGSYSGLFGSDGRGNEKIMYRSALKYNKFVVIPMLHLSSGVLSIIESDTFSNAVVLYLEEQYNSYGSFAPSVKTIYYNGLQREWKNSIKSTYPYTVFCIDGTINTN